MTAPAGIRERSFPPDSALAAFATGADFADSWEAPLRDPALDPVDIFLRNAKASPGWVETLMDWRNRAVALLGLKAVGRMGETVARPAAAYLPGERIGIFTLLSRDQRELVMGIDDRHLDVRVSILKYPLGDGWAYATSTAVRVHNTLGRLYMLPVGRVHPLIVRTLMARAAA